MGNFGKRLLIVLLSALAVVGLALIGNAYQQAERIHKVSNASSVVLDQNNIKLTKKDVWKTILYSNPMSSVSEMIDKEILASVISDVKSQGTNTDEYKNKKNTLVYGTADEDELNEMDNETKGEKEKQWANQLVILGTAEDDYIYLQLAYDRYATYRLVNGLEIGGKTYDVSDETLKKEIESSTGDVYAIAIKFYSEKDASTFIENYVNKDTNLTTLNNEIRYYVGGSLYKASEDAELTFNGTDYEFTKMTVTLSDETTKDVPNASLLTDADEKYIYDETYKAFVSSHSEKLKDNNGNVVKDENGNEVYSKYVLVKLNDNNDGWVYYTKYTTAFNTIDGQDEDGNPTTTTDYDHWTQTVVDDSEIVTNDDDTIKSYKDATFTTSNTLELTQNLFLDLYVRMYNSYYELQNKSVTATATYADFTAKQSDTTKLNEMLKEYGYVVVENEIRKYVGDSEYVVDYEKSTNGKVVYKTVKNSAGKEIDLPNYKLTEGYFDKNDNLVYVIDGDGNRIPNDDKLEFDKVTSFTTSNTISASEAELYGLYVALFASEENPGLVYNYDKVNENRSALATQLFTTLKGTDYLKSSTKIGDDYYLIFKLQSASTKLTDEEINAKLDELKKEKINEYVSNASFVKTCLAELRKEAGLKIFDEFFSYEYNSMIANNSNTNSYGPSETDSYYKTKAYSARKLATIKAKNIKISDTQTYSGKYTVKADDLYDYVMSYASASYVSTAYLNKYLLSMPEFETIHGNKVEKVNYLTSKNWKVKKYASQAEEMNRYFEYYRAMYAQYGISYTYSSIEQFLYQYGSRSFDDLVTILERSTMRSVYLYKTLLGLDKMNYELIGKDFAWTTDYAQQAFGAQATKFNDITNNYLDVNVNHLLVYLDLDEDGNPDDYTGNYADFNTNGTYATYDALLDALYDEVTSFIHDGSNESLTKGDSDVLSDFVTAYNDASRKANAEDLDKALVEFKKYGVHVKYESLGEVTSSSIKNYVKEFQDEIRVLKTKLDEGDNDLLGYSLSDGFTQTEFGLHFVYAYNASNSEVPSFKFEDEDNAYASGMTNENDEISPSQIALYMLEYYYGLIYGKTDHPEENAGFSYPNLPTEITDKIDTLYGDYLSLVMDKSYTYMSIYTILNSLQNTDKFDFASLKETYRIAIFEED